jgi:Zn-dependent alcohol dehydrogenase
MQARAAVMPERHGRWTLETVEVAEPGPQEVLVRVVASGICQTDVHARDGFFPIPYPAVYGHEGAGVVEQGAMPSRRSDMGSDLSGRPYLGSAGLTAYPR